MATIATEAGTVRRQTWYVVLYIQVLIAIVLGELFGWLEARPMPTTIGSMRSARPSS